MSYNKKLEMGPPRSKMQSEQQKDSEVESENQSHHSASGNDFNEDASYDNANENPARLDAVLQELLPDIKLTFEKWAKTFSECESFENLYPTRMDEIINDAKCLERQLILQKETLKERLKFLTRTLASPPLEEIEN